MKTFLSDVRRNKELLLIALPVLVYVALFSYIPMFGIIIAFKDFDYSLGIFGSEWCGLKNFELLFKMKDSFTLIRNTVLYNIVWIPLSVACSVFLALMFDAIGKERVGKINKVNQTLSILPHFLSWVVISYFVDALLNVDKGILNRAIVALGGEKKNWYFEIKYWPYILTVVHLWKGIGYSAIVYYSTIRGFGREYYEAAMIDGATWGQQTRKITIPLLKPIITIMMIMSLSHILNSDFGLFYIIPKNSGILYPVTSTLDTYIYNAMTSGGDLSVTGAISFFKSVVGFLLILIVNGVVNKIDPERALF